MALSLRCCFLTVDLDKPLAKLVPSPIHLLVKEEANNSHYFTQSG